MVYLFYVLFRMCEDSVMGKRLPFDAKDDINRAILQTIALLERRNGRVYPYQVAMGMYQYMPCGERMIRYRMVMLAQAGALARLGERKGYVTMTRYEARFCLPLSGGLMG